MGGEGRWEVREGGDGFVVSCLWLVTGGGVSILAQALVEFSLDGGDDWLQMVLFIGSEALPLF